MVAMVADFVPRVAIALFSNSRYSTAAPPVGFADGLEDRKDARAFRRGRREADTL